MNDHGSTPLSEAALRGYEAIVKQLLNTNGVDSNLRTEYGLTPLSKSVLERDEEEVELLQGSS